MEENDKKTKTSLKGVFLLLLTAMIWGVSFVSQSVGSESIQPFTFMGIRTFMGACVLLPFILIRDKISSGKMTEQQIAERRKNNRKSIKYGIIVGIFLCGGNNFQQQAFTFSNEPGKIAFITASYMFFVPVASIFMKKKLPVITWLCVLAGFAGLYFLCIKDVENFSIGLSEILTLCCALFFTVQILLIEKFAPDCDGIKLSCAEFFTAGSISLILMAVFETPSWSGICQGGIALLYSGILSCGVAFTLQTVGQKYCEATIASLLMCMESVFAVLSSALILGKNLSAREITGCSIMFAAIIISQLSQLKKHKAV